MRRMRNARADPIVMEYARRTGLGVQARCFVRLGNRLRAEKVLHLC
jgi:hypothetical protein